MEKDKIIDMIAQDPFGDEEIYDVIPDEFDTTTDYMRANPDKIGDVMWHRGKPILPFSSLCDKTKSIFTMVKGIPIEIRENDGENYIYKEKGKYIINITKKPTNGLNKYTVFNHELAHYAFDSSNTDFPDYIDEELAKIPPEHKDKALEIYRSVFNVIEDQRVESLLGETYLGTGMRFRHARRRMGEQKGKDYKSWNPLDALHCAREYKSDAIPKEWSEANEAMDLVELKDKDASVALSKKYIKDVVNPWIIEQLNNCKGINDVVADKEGKPSYEKIQGMPITCKGDLTKAFQKAFTDNRACDHRELESETGECGNAKDMCDKVNQGMSLEELLEQSGLKAEDLIQQFKDKIEEEARNARTSFCPNSDKIVETSREHPHNTPEPNYEVARGINKVLKFLQIRNRPKIKDTGEEVSIPDVIRRKARGFGDVFIQKKNTNKLAICVSIDASGSMNGSPIDIARDMMATMYKAIDGVKDVELRGVVWAGDNEEVGVTQVHSLKECRFIHTNHGQYGGTPTPYAVEYSERVMEEMKAKKKLLVIITDGYPNSVSGGIPSEQLVRREVNRARKRGIGTLGLWVGGSRGDSNMELMFGKDGYVGVDSMKEASDKVIKEFKKVVLSQFK
jgi:hypothetical protein